MLQILLATFPWGWGPMYCIHHYQVRGAGEEEF